MKKICIIGGVAGGATAAARLRRMDENATIIMFERGEYISFANCGLPYYLGGVITDRDQLLLQTPQSFYQRFAVDVRIASEVKQIHPNTKEISVLDLKTGKEYRESYDELLLSPGAAPLQLPIAGAEAKGVFQLRSMTDTDVVKNFITTHKPQKALVVGAGFIGIEMAENLMHAGLSVSIAEAGSQVMPMLDTEMAAILHHHLVQQGVDLQLNAKLQSIDLLNGKLVCSFANGDSLSVDMVILSAGVRPETALAVDAGIELGPSKGIAVNEYLETSIPHIYAVGDVAEVKHRLGGYSFLPYLAGPANKQARIVADNMLNPRSQSYNGALGTAIAKVVELTAAAVGLSERQCAARGIVAQSYIVHGSSHAGYYPGALPLVLKLVFDPTNGKVLGAQCVGQEGVDKRIDIIATALSFDATVSQLKEIEHAYAPPFASAKDPIHIAAYSAENIMRGLFKPAYWSQIGEFTAKGAVLLDVRTADEFALGSLPSAINVPVDTIRQKSDTIPRNKPILVFCGVGLRGYVAARILLQSGFTDVYNLSGGLKVYTPAVTPIANIKPQNNTMATPTSTIPRIDVPMLEINACGLQCPGPIMKLKTELDKLQVGQQIRQTASDPGFYSDVQSWCRVTGNTLVSVVQERGIITAVIEKGQAVATQNTGTSEHRNKTLVVFSDDLDRALASFVIANGAASTGKKVTMFFTFWGLSIIKKRNKPSVKKDFMGRMFSMMLPSSSNALSLSKINMFGMGRWMMRKRMTAKNIDQLETLMQSAIDAGVEIIACHMSMDMMGIHRDELIDNISVGGVATYIERTEDANMNLFV